MGRDYYEASPHARTALDEAEAVLGAGFLDRIFSGSQQELHDTRTAQVALVAVGVAIARHLSLTEVAPDGAAGHSVGEIAALVAADALDFSDALRLTRERARLMAETPADGTMAAVIGLDPALPGQNCCTVTLTGDLEAGFQVQILAGDVNFSGRVNATDKNLVKGEIGEIFGPGNFVYDVNTTGTINATDKNLVKGWINNLSPECP